MKLKNILYVVKDIEQSKKFYQELFGLYVINDFGENVILSEGLVLQEQKLWETFIGQKTAFGGNDAELYFEENDIDGFLCRLEQTEFLIRYVNPMMEHDWGQRVIRIYDLDMHVIEIGESLEYVARRFLRAGMSIEETAKKTQLPIQSVEMIAGRNQVEELY